MTLSGFPNGISAMGVPFPIVTTGDIFFVDLAGGQDSNKGKDKSHSLLTISQAHSKAANANDDVVLVSNKGTVTDNITITKEGFAIWGIPAYESLMGGSARITNTTAGKNIFDIQASKVRIENIRLSYGSDLLAICFSDPLCAFQTVIRNVNITLNNADSYGLGTRSTHTITDSLIENVSIQGAEGITAAAGLFLGNGVTRNVLVRDVYISRVTDGVNVGTATRSKFQRIIMDNTVTTPFTVTGTSSLIFSCVTASAISGTTALLGDNTVVS